MKKGVFFTFIALFVVILIIAVVTTKNQYRYREKSEAVASRIRTMNNFISDLERDFDRAMFIGGYRTILSMNEYLRMREDYITDFDTIFGEILINGTAEGVQMSLMEQGTSQGANFASWLERVNEVSLKSNIFTNMNVEGLHVQHISPWVVELIVNTTVNISDVKGLASWSFIRTYTKQFSIFGFEDPLYIVATRDRVTNLINVTPNMDFVDEATKDPTVLNFHVNESFYINSSRAPSYLMRFTGDFSPSPYGIESIVNILDVQAQSGDLNEFVYAKSLIDFKYFNPSYAPLNEICHVDNMTSWFRIDYDETYLTLYQIHDQSGNKILDYVQSCP